MIIPRLNGILQCVRHFSHSRFKLKQMHRYVYGNCTTKQFNEFN